jgi:hypothetical protein
VTDFTAAPYNWVINATSGGYLGRRRQASSFVEQFGETMPVLLQRISSYEGQVQLPLSIQEVYGSLGFGDGGFGENGFGGALLPGDYTVR